MAKGTPIRSPIFRETIAPADGVDVHPARGTIGFESARRRLAKLATRELEQVSDSDVREYLARGELNTRAYLSAGLT